MEKEIICLWPRNQFHFWRESVVNRAVPKSFPSARHKLGPPGSATMAYALSDDGKTITRIWWLWSPLTHLDGVEPPRENDKTEFVFVVPTSIKPNKVSAKWDPQGPFVHPRLDKHPLRLINRWQTWDTKYRRVIKRPGKVREWIRKILRM